MKYWNKDEAFVIRSSSYSAVAGSRKGGAACFRLPTQSNTYSTSSEFKSLMRIDLHGVFSIAFGNDETKAKPDYPAYALLSPVKLYDAIWRVMK